jgi:2,4-diketo-3-deoxy-L-fuconate hydrolase
MDLAAARYVTTDGDTRIGAVRGDVIIDAGPAGPRGFVPSRAGWAEIAAADGRATRLSDARLLHPVEPSKVLCIGLNYLEHARESNMQLPDAPLIFAKVSSSLIGPGAAIVLPEQEAEPDFEAEVAVVIGTLARNVSEADAASYIGGITAFNDVSGRSAQFGDGQWTRGKGYDTFGPLGPVIVPSAGVDLAAIEVSCTLSGETMQQSSTADLIFSIPYLVSYLSRQFTLYPGDVIATGTPAGVGVARTPQRFLRSGDTVEVFVGGVGVLSNPVA